MTSAPSRLRVSNPPVFCIAFDTASLPPCIGFIGVMATPCGGGLAHFTDLDPASPGLGGTFSVPVRALDQGGITRALVAHRERFSAEPTQPTTP